jgi:hypothetical protein
MREFWRRKKRPDDGFIVIARKGASRRVTVHRPSRNSMTAQNFQTMVVIHKSKYGTYSWVPRLEEAPRGSEGCVLCGTEGPRLSGA